MTSLHESLRILDCYRVCILQRPPSLLWRNPESLPRSVSGKESFSSIRNLIKNVLNPGFPVNTEAIEEFSLATLSGLSPFLWGAMPMAPADNDWVKTLSKSDFVELAADKWLRSHHNSAEPASLVLYHLINIAMHTNLLLVQRYVHLRSKSDNLDKNQDPYQASIVGWVGGRHYQTAKWHAEKILECVEAANNVGLKEEMNSARHNGTQRASLSSEANKGEIDIAHVPYAIYYATLILWCGAAAVDGQSASTGLPYLARGTTLLSQQKLRIAKLLERVLREGER